MKLTSHEVGFILTGVLKTKTRVKELRLAAGYTQAQLAERVNVSVRTIISIEKEQYNPSLMLAYKLACVFNTSVEKLCCLKQNIDAEEKGNEI